MLPHFRFLKSGLHNVVKVLEYGLVKVSREEAVQQNLALILRYASYSSRWDRREIGLRSWSENSVRRGQ